MDRREIKERAKAQLGGRLFGENWLMAVLSCIVFAVIESVAGTVLPAIGAVLLMGPMNFGLNYLFLKQTRDGRAMQIPDLFKGFDRTVGENLLLGFLIWLFTFLWSLLFVIPGIVKAYSYSMAYYVKVDHPEYDWRQCIDASRQLTAGHKWELFVLDLSFIGWIFVGALVFGIGTLWVIPYQNAAKAQFYQQLVMAPTAGNYAG